MLTKDKSDMRSQIEILSLDQLVPENHLVRKLEVAKISISYMTL